MMRWACAILVILATLVCLASVILWTRSHTPRAGWRRWTQNTDPLDPRTARPKHDSFITARGVEIYMLAGEIRVFICHAGYHQPVLERGDRFFNRMLEIATSTKRLQTDASAGGRLGFRPRERV